MNTQSQTANDRTMTEQKKCCWQRWMRGRLLTSILLLVISLLSAPVGAQGVDFPQRRNTFTPGELAILPPYCSNMQGFPGYEGPAGDRWRGLLGEDFQHFHHYCRGLRDVHFARTAVVNVQQRRFLWERSISEYQYMIRNSKPTMALLPEIYFKMGESFLELGRLSDAQLAFESARKLKPDYWPAYTRWIDELLKLKQFATAREVAEVGLRQLPDHPELRVRLEHAHAGMGSRAPR